MSFHAFPKSPLSLFSVYPSNTPSPSPRASILHVELPNAVSSQCLVVGGGLAVVADELEAANHLSDGEESEALCENDAAGDELSSADVANALDGGAGGLENATGPDGLPDVLVVCLEGGDGTAQAQAVSIATRSDIRVRLEGTYGGFMLWPRNTILAISRPTLE